MSEENRFEKKKKQIVIVGIIGLLLGASTGVMFGLFINEFNKYNVLSGDYDELYIDYLELLYDFNILNEKYFNLTGEYIELENDYSELINDYDTLLEAYESLLNDYNTLLDAYNALLAGLTLTQIETLCNADTYISELEPDANFGSEQYWYVGEDEYTWDWFIAFFNFSLINKPETYEKVEIQLIFPTMFGLEGIYVPVKYYQEWNESTLTYNNMIFPDPDYLSYSFHFNMMTYSAKMIIDVTEWVNTNVDSVSIAVVGGMKSMGYSREHPNQDMVPKLIWTVIGASV